MEIDLYLDIFDHKALIFSDDEVTAKLTAE